MDIPKSGQGEKNAQATNQKDAIHGLAHNLVLRAARLDSACCSATARLLACKIALSTAAASSVCEALYCPASISCPNEIAALAASSLDSVVVSTSCCAFISSLQSGALNFDVAGERIGVTDGHANGSSA